MTESWLSMQGAFERGGIAHGNIEGALHAEAARIEFSGGTDCPNGCGSVIAYQVGLPPLDSVYRHTRNPAACRKHVAHKRPRKKRRSR